MSAASIARPAAALLRRHSSLLLMGVGVGAQLLATVYFYQRLSPADYAQLAVVLTFIGLVAAFGLLGAEQLMLRLASTDGRATLSLPLNAYRLLYWALLLGPILLSACALAVWGLALHWAYPLALLGAGLMLVFNGLRLLSRFALAQFINNSWRYSLLLLLGLSYLGWPLTLAQLVIGLGVAMALALAAACVWWRWRVSSNIVAPEPGAFSLYGAYGLSMAIITALGFYDRIGVGLFSQAEAYGQYFFFYSVFYAPFGFMANYVGFKGLVAYKLQFDYPQFRRRLGYSVIVSLLLAFGFACLALAVDEWLLGRRYLGGNWALIAPLLLLGVLRLVYAHFSAVFGARATRQMIVSANAKTLLALLGVSLGAYGTGLVDMLSIVWSACLIWLLRNGFFYAELSAANTALGTEKRG